MIENQSIKILAYKLVSYGGFFICGYFGVLYSIMYKYPVGLALTSIVMFVGLFLFIVHMMMDFMLTLNFSLKQTLYEFQVNVNEQSHKNQMQQLIMQINQQQELIQRLMNEGGMEPEEDE